MEVNNTDLSVGQAETSVPDTIDVPNVEKNDKDVIIKMSIKED